MFIQNENSSCPGQLCSLLHCVLFKHSCWADIADCEISLVSEKVCRIKPHEIQRERLIEFVCFFTHVNRVVRRPFQSHYTAFSSIIFATKTRIALMSCLSIRNYERNTKNDYSDHSLLLCLFQPLPPSQLHRGYDIFVNIVEYVIIVSFKGDKVAVAQSMFTRNYPRRLFCTTGPLILLLSACICGYSNRKRFLAGDILFVF